MTGQINVNKIAARTGNTITVNSGDKISGAAGSIVAPGQVIQTANSNTNTEFQFTTAGSWVNTGLVSMTFPNVLQTGSKVLVRVYATLGEANHNTWGAATAITIFENSETNQKDFMTCIICQVNSEGFIKDENCVAIDLIFLTKDETDFNTFGKSFGPTTIKRTKDINKNSGKPISSIYYFLEFMISF